MPISRKRRRKSERDQYQTVTHESRWKRFAKMCMALIYSEPLHIPRYPSHKGSVWDAVGNDLQVAMNDLNKALCKQNGGNHVSR